MLTQLACFRSSAVTCLLVSCTRPVTSPLVVLLQVYSARWLHHSTANLRQVFLSACNYLAVCVGLAAIGPQSFTFHPGLDFGVVVGGVSREVVQMQVTFSNNGPPVSFSCVCTTQQKNQVVLHLHDIFVDRCNILGKNLIGNVTGFRLCLFGPRSSDQLFYAFNTSTGRLPVCWLARW